jgi:hypothetical protein
MRTIRKGRVVLSCAAGTSASPAETVMRPKKTAATEPSLAEVIIRQTVLFLRIRAKYITWVGLRRLYRLGRLISCERLEAPNVGDVVFAADKPVMKCRNDSPAPISSSREWTGSEPRLMLSASTAP